MKNTILLLLPALWIAATPFLTCGGEAKLLQDQTSRFTQTDAVPFGVTLPRTLPEAYRKEAIRLILQEANQVATALKLREILPINEAGVRESYLSPINYAQETGALGNITTRAYAYYVSKSNKLCYIESPHQATDCEKWAKEYLWPLARMDTNAALQLAAEWLKATSMDLAALSRDFQLTVEADHVYVRPPPGKFVPVYNVAWCRPFQANPDIIYGSGTPKGRSVASVRLFLPTKTLMHLRVEDAKYILRPPVTFTNLDALLPKPKRE